MEDKAKLNNLKSARHAARLRIVQALYQWQFSQTDVDLETIERDYLALDADLRSTSDTTPSGSDEQFDAVYFKRLWQGIVKHSHSIDAKLETLTDRPLKLLTPIEYAVLRLGAYELLYEPDIPYRVAINEALELTKYYGTRDGYKYVNGVLDKLANQVSDANE